MCKGLAALPATCLKSAKDIKHRIGFLLQKPDPPPDQKASKEKAPLVKRVDPIDVEKWKLSFNNVINNEAGQTAFTLFLKSEFSKENIDFWMACEDYKTTSPEEQPRKAKEIFDQYVEMDSPNEVNLDSATREETRRNLQQPDITSFDAAQSKIVTLMEKDSYRRFLKSKLFLELCQSSLGSTYCGLDRSVRRNLSDSSHLVPFCA